MHKISQAIAHKLKAIIAIVLIPLIYQPVSAAAQLPLLQKGVVPRPAPAPVPAPTVTPAPVVPPVLPQVSTTKPVETNEQRLARLKAYADKFDIKKQAIGKSAAQYHRHRRRRRKKASAKKTAVTASSATAVIAAAEPAATTTAAGGSAGSTAVNADDDLDDSTDADITDDPAEDTQPADAAATN